VLCGYPETVSVRVHSWLITVFKKLLSVGPGPPYMNYLSLCPRCALWLLSDRFIGEIKDCEFSVEVLCGLVVCAGCFDLIAEITDNLSCVFKAL